VVGQLERQPSVLAAAAADAKRLLEQTLGLVAQPSSRAAT
jgi:hypothetical protein